jgi:hypothetical protein
MQSYDAWVEPAFPAAATETFPAACGALSLSDEIAVK